MKHWSLVSKAGIEDSATVGGIIQGKDGKLLTMEHSGSFGMKWTPELRRKFIEFMKARGVDIEHEPWTN
jgi:filamentous hemagglutinin